MRAGRYADRAIDAARDRAGRADGWRIVEMEAGHDVMVDAPDPTAALLAEAGGD